MMPKRRTEEWIRPLYREIETLRAENTRLKQFIEGALTYNVGVDRIKLRDWLSKGKAMLKEMRKAQECPVCSGTGTYPHRNCILR